MRIALQQKPGALFRQPGFPRALAGLFALIALAGLAVLPRLLTQAAPSKRSFLWGYSLNWLLVVAAMGVLALIFAGLALWFWRKPGAAAHLFNRLAQRPRLLAALAVLAGVIFLAGWVGTLLPEYQLGRFQVFFERLKPVVNWMALAGGICLPVLLVQLFGLQPVAVARIWRERRRRLLPYAIALLALLACWLVIASTGLGISADRFFWNENGVPLLGLQILLAWLLAWGLIVVEPALLRRIPPGWLDGILILALWLAAAWLWNSQPLEKNFFAPGPYPPTGEHVPFSDAETFDRGAQYMLIGQGYANGRFFDRGLYMGFLALFHAIAGQDYSDFVGLQVAVFAVLPVLIYLLGKALHGRGLGLAAGLLAVLKESNAIASSGRIGTAHSQLLMTEFPMLILVVLFSLWLVAWLRRTQREGHFAILSGAALGFGSMLRLNALFLLPLAGFLSFLGYWRAWRRWLVTLILLVLGIFASIAPWMVRNEIVAGRGFFYLRRVNDVIEARYADLYPDDPSEAAPEQPDTPSPESTTKSRAAGIAAFVGAHFAHNLVASFVELPLSPRYDDLDTTLEQGFPWDRDWQGALTGWAIPMAALNLGLLAVGLGAAWRRLHFAGLAPLGVFLAYNLSNSFARASGGRYLVPMDWVVTLYFALGLVQLAIWLTNLLRVGALVEQNADALPSKYPRLRSYLAPLAVILLIASLLPLSELLVPQRYAADPQPETLLDQLEENGALAQMGLTRTAVEAFLRTPSAVILTGRELYPRFYAIDNGEPDRYSAYKALPYPRLAFRVIGPQATVVSILPLDASPAQFPNGSDVIVLGCRSKSVLDAYAVALLYPQPVTLVRSPGAVLFCPLPAPVCDNNRVCR